MAAHRFTRDNLCRRPTFGVLLQPLQAEKLSANRFRYVVKLRDQWMVRFHSRNSMGLKEVREVYGGSFPLFFAKSALAR